mmetsp:Transcript_4182/g.10778  ORF Transcript_4182/g.10778 Transcript_4182/m.10778 type:complete len:218 (+) Transcript_4182:77-730(+)
MAAADHGCPRQSTMTIQLRSFQSTRPQTTPCEQQPRRRSLQSDAVLVRARLCDVPHPLYRLIVALLEHLKEAHVQARGGKHGNLEIHRDWRPAPRLVVHAGDHLDLATQRVLRVTWEAAKSPHDRRLIRLILGLTCGRVYVHLRSILGQWDLDEHARREELEGEHGLHLSRRKRTRLAGGRVDEMGRSMCPGAHAAGRCPHRTTAPPERLSTALSTP